MGIPWRKLLLGVKSTAALGSLLGVPWASTIVSSIHAVEENLPGIKGAQKREAAKAMAIGIIRATESGARRDLLNDPAVLAAMDRFIDAYVAFMNALALAAQVTVEE